MNRHRRTGRSILPFVVVALFVQRISFTRDIAATAAALTTPSAVAVAIPTAGCFQTTPLNNRRRRVVSFDTHRRHGPTTGLMISLRSTQTTAAPQPDDSRAELIFAWRDSLQTSTGTSTARSNSISSRDELSTVPVAVAASSSFGQSVPKVQLILASQSPRRKEILDLMGLAGRFVTVTSPLDESAVASELRQRSDVYNNPSVYTRILAERKAMALAQDSVGMAMAMAQMDRVSSSSSSTTRLILASDTVVAWNDHILEKPIDANDAVRMLQLLQGQSHVVHTGVALVRVNERPLDESNNEKGVLPVPVVRLINSWTDTATVQLAPLTDADIRAYVATLEPMDKAGSYGIQGIGGQLVTSIQGDFFTVMGLPMHRTSRLLALAVADIVHAKTSVDSPPMKGIL